MTFTKFNGPMKKQKKKEVKRTIWQKTESYLARKKRFLTGLLIGISLLVSLLLFDMRINEGGDDATYIEKAYSFVHSFTYPTFQGPLYPIVLSPVILLLGINLFWLKFLSVIFMAGFIAIFIKAFREFLPFTVVFFATLIITINPYVQYYASLTYSEAFFLFLTAIFFYYFNTRFIRDEVHLKKNLKENYREYLMMAVLVLILGLTRTIGFLALIAIIIYFLTLKQWKPALITLVTFIILIGAYELLKNLIWGVADLQFHSQLDSLLLKDPYRAGLGKENLAGYWNRIVENTNSYISRDTLTIFGLRPDPSRKSGLLTILFLVIIIPLAIYGSYKNKFVRFVSLFVFILAGTTFVMVQPLWHQYRLFMIFIPWLILVFFASIYYISDIKNFYSVKNILLILMILLLTTGLIRSLKRINLNQKALTEYLKGNQLYGFTPDYINYIKASQWAAENVPDSVNIGCRKGSISFIYSDGRKFYNITNVPSVTPEEYLSQLKNDQFYLSVDESRLEDRSVAEEVESVILPYLEMFCQNSERDSTGGSTVTGIFGIYKFPEPETYNLAKSLLESKGIEYRTDILQFVTFLKNSTEATAIYNPDDLLNKLKDNKVGYIIAASLRVNPAQKTGRTISTIDKYLAMVNRKYPGFFSTLHVEGTQDNEPAYVLQLNY